MIRGILLKGSEDFFGVVRESGAFAPNESYMCAVRPIFETVHDVRKT